MIQFWIDTLYNTYWATSLGQIELAAVILTVINVALIARNSTWNYMFGIPAVLLFGYVFMEYKLYSDMGLQWFFYVPMQIIGWWMWVKQNRASVTNEGRIYAFDVGAKAVTAIVVAATSLALGYTMANYTDASFPYLDAFITCASVVAQLLLLRRIWDNWMLWISVDVVGIYVYWSKELYATSALYFGLLIIATIGMIAWTRKLPDINEDNYVITPHNGKLREL